MRRILILAMLVMALAACGGSSGGGNVAAGPAGDPVGAVNNFINAIKAKATDKLGPLVCAAKREEILGQLGGAASGAPSDLAAAMGFDFKDVKVEQKSVDGDKGVVHVTGSMTITFDAAKGKAAVRKMLEAAVPSGTVVTDQQVDQMIAGISSGKATDISSDVDVVKENGGWVVCSKFAST